MTLIRFPEFMPDQSDYENPGMVQATNCIPKAFGYDSFPDSLEMTSAASSVKIQGAFSGRTESGAVFTVAGDATSLLLQDSTSFTSVSRATAYATASDEFWRFAQIDNCVYATNYADEIQQSDIGSATVTFSDLAGGPPKARHIATVRNFLVVGNTEDATDGKKPQRVRWSGINNPETWTVSAVTLSDFQDLKGNYGFIQGVVGGEQGIIFRERAITRMTFVGSPAVFRFDDIELDRGCLAPNSIIRKGSVIYFLADDGFYGLSGQQTFPIGDEKVNRFFFDEIDLPNSGNVFAAYFPDEDAILWAFPGKNNIQGRANRILYFNINQQRWSLIEDDVEFFFNTLASGFTLDQLDSVSTSIDNLPFSLDSRAYEGNMILLAGFNSDHRLVSFNGPAKKAIFETAEVRLIANKRAQLNKFRIPIEGTVDTSITARVGIRDTIRNDVEWGPYLTERANGDFKTRNNSFHHRLRIEVSGGFSKAIGVDVVDVVERGNR